MKSTTPPHLGSPGARLARIGEAEGWLSLAATAGLFFIPASPPLTETFGTYLVASIFGVGTLLGIDGVRFSRGPGRRAAVGSMAILALVLLAFVVRSLLNWDQIRRYWGI